MKKAIAIILILVTHVSKAQEESSTPENTSMTSQLINNLLIQSQMSNGYALSQVSIDNLTMRLNEKAASVGFIYRHIAETMHLFGTFLGEQTAIQNTTMGQMDEGQGSNFEESQQLLTSGYILLQDIIDKNSDDWWLEEIETPFFGKVNRLRLFSHILYHNAYHSGQIALTISKGVKL